MAAIKINDHPDGLQIVEAICKSSALTTYTHQSELEPYKSYCEQELRLLGVAFSKESWPRQASAIRTYDDIALVSATLSNCGDCIRPDIRRHLQQHFSQASTIELNRAIDLVLRLQLMINFREFEFETLRHESACVQWDDISSLRAFLVLLFPKARWNVSPAKSRPGRHFTASFLTRVCGIRIVWTSSLADHLRLDLNQGVLLVFPYKQHLEWLLTEGETRCPIPPAVLEETIQSLNLLFPLGDRDTNIFLTKEKQSFHLSRPHVMQADSMSFSDFDHWRDRLLEVREVLDAPPVSWAQLWRDRRNPQQFWTFWIALIILALTALSLIASVVQAWATLKALQLAVEQIAK